MIPRILMFALVVLLAGASDGATLIVNLPGADDAPLRVVDNPPSPSGPRIQCPPTCTYESEGDSIGIIELRVSQDDDPRTNDPPYDIVAINGCAGTSALPNPTASCRLPDQGSAIISFETRYRPILAVQATGEIGAEVFNLFVSGSTGEGYEGGTAGSFNCEIAPSPGKTPQELEVLARSCANHYSVDQPVVVQARENPPISVIAGGSCNLVPDPPSAQRCEFVLSGDTCVNVEYRHDRPEPFEADAVFGPDCPTGQGVPGTVGGGGGGALPPEIMERKQAALALLRIEFERVVYPCLVASGGVAIFAALAPTGPAIPLVIGGGLVTVASPLCAIGIHRIMQFQLIYNDPPDPNFQEVAKVPKKTKFTLDVPDCTDFAGAEKRFCKKFGKGMTKYVEKDDRVDDLAETLRITVERAVGAHQSNDEKALKKQLRAAKKRQRQLESAIRKRARQGGKLGKLLAKEQATIALDATQFTEGSDAALADLVSEGLPEDDARELLGATLDPRTLDWLGLIATE